MKEITVRCSGVEYLPLSSLTPLQGNLKELSKENLNKLKKSLLDNGFCFPFFVWKDGDNNYILDGTQRDRALKHLEETGEVKLPSEYPVVYVRAKDKKDAANLLLLATSQYGKMTHEGLYEFMHGNDLNIEEMKLSINFDAVNMDTFVNAWAPEKEGLTDADDVPETPENAITKPGDLWIMGGHKLLCGDCRESSDMLRLFGGDKMAVCVTSPPYASQREYDSESGFKPINPDDYCDWFMLVQKLISEHMSTDGSFFLNIKEHCEEGQRHLYVKDLILAHVREWGWEWVEEYAWIHSGTPKGVINRFKNAWEPIFQFTRGGDFKFRPDSVRHISDDIPDWGGGHPSDENGLSFQSESGPILGGLSIKSGLAYPSNVLSVGKNREALGHGAAYPVSLPEFFIKAYSDEGDIVFDPFMGSGSTMIAAEINNRLSFGMEISPKYCDIIVKRWEEFTGKKAVLEKR